MNGVRRFLGGGPASSSSQSDSAPSSLPPQQPDLQELFDSQTSIQKTTTAALFLRREKQHPQLPPDDDPSNSSFQSSSRPASGTTSLTSSPASGSKFYAQGSPLVPNRPTLVSRKSVDIYNESKPLNTRDELLMSLLASEAVVDSRGFEILSSEQVEDLKKEHQVLCSRLIAVTRKLALETKIRDAALSLSKVNSTYRGVAKRTSEELDAANRKVDFAQMEFWKVSERANEVYRKLLEHRAGVLSFSVRSMEEKQAADGGMSNSNGIGLPPGFNSPMSSTSSALPLQKFEHFFAGHAESVVPQVLSKPLSTADVAALEEKLQAVTDSLNEASKKQAETALDLSLLKLEKEQMAASMEMELQTAEETISALEKEISRLDDVNEQVVAFQKEKSVWEKDRAELEARRQEVETLERRLEILEERSGEATEMERIIAIREQEIARLKEEWEAERASLEIDRSSGATAQLDDVHATLRTLVRDHGVELRSQNPSSLSELVDSISSHLNGFYEERENLERKVRNCIAEREGLAQAFEDARSELEESRQEIRDLEAQSTEQSSASLPPVEYRGDASDIVAVLMPIWKVLPSAEARGAKLGQSRFKPPSSNVGTGNPMKSSLSEMDVRGLKTLYDAGKSDPLQGSATFVIDKFVSRVQALITDNHALIERLIQFTQAHDLLKKNVERAHKLASDSNAALETYQKQVKALEERDINLSTKHAALLGEVRHLEDALERAEDDKRDLEMQAAEQAETCRQLTDANNALSAKTLGLAEEAASATDVVRKQMEAQLKEYKTTLQKARAEIEAMQNSEQTQRVALLEELNTMQTENSNLRDQLRNRR